MKKYVTIFITVILVLAALPFANGCTSAGGDKPIRIHIRANSDGDYDQAVKYIVRDAVVEYLSPSVSSAHSRSEAYSRISSQLNEIEKNAMGVLSKCGFMYGANARMSREYFPDRNYGDVSYPAGYYDALIVELGSGKGGNWWCVAYPPLCFYGDDGEEFHYSSLIGEMLGK